MNEAPCQAGGPIEALVARATPPVLVLSTAVGRGMLSIGEAIRERFAPHVPVFHHPIEAFLPARAVREDVARYRFISMHAPVLLNLVYRFPLLYWRKQMRERVWRRNDLAALRSTITGTGARTVICVSHRAAFWTSRLKQGAGLDFALWDVLAEYGHNWGYKYLFWDAIDAFLSPVARTDLRFSIPGHVAWWPVDLPARSGFSSLAAVAGRRDEVLLAGGFWGQGRIERLLAQLLGCGASIKVHVICGQNDSLRARLSTRFGGSGVAVYGALDSIAPVLERCAAVVTKPGISTLLEARAARRKIFLVRGMPVAEDNNARFAVEHFGAEWFSPHNFSEWLAGA